MNDLPNIARWFWKALPHRKWWTINGIFHLFFDAIWN